MAHPAPTAPPEAGQRVVSIVENVLIAARTYRVRLDDPEMARTIRPGQFLMIRSTLASSDPLLGRPFALYDVVLGQDGQPWAIDIVYLAMGRGTAALAEKRTGDRVSVWGPLGNGFSPPVPGDAVFVAGGIGQTPFLALSHWWRGERVYGGISFADGPRIASATLLYGVRSADLAAGLDDFTRAGIAVELATDDGSAGYPGRVTDLLSQRLERGDRPSKVVGCGPSPMLKALAQVARDHQLDCDLSLENHMACGFGACFSCVTPIYQEDGSTDLKRICVEGPIFPACQVAW